MLIRITCDLVGLNMRVLFFFHYLCNLLVYYLVFIGVYFYERCEPMARQKAMFPANIFPASYWKIYGGAWQLFYVGVKVGKAAHE